MFAINVKIKKQTKKKTQEPELFSEIYRHWIVFYS